MVPPCFAALPGEKPPLGRRARQGTRGPDAVTGAPVADSARPRLAGAAPRPCSAAALPPVLSIVGFLWGKADRVLFSSPRFSVWTIVGVILFRFPPFANGQSAAILPRFFHIFGQNFRLTPRRVPGRRAIQGMRRPAKNRQAAKRTGGAQAACRRAQTYCFKSSIAFSSNLDLSILACLR